MGKKRIPDYDNAEHMITGIIEFSDEKCTRCGICASLCPGRSIVLPPKTDDGKKPLPYAEEIAPSVTACMSCGDCLAACPNGAITIKRGFRVKEPYFYHRITQTTQFTYPKKY